MSSKQVQFDVFLAHNSQDKPDLRLIAEKLRQRQLNPWLDEDEIPPGRWFQDSIQEAVPNVKSAAVFIGSRGLGRFQAVELRTFISQCVEANIPVIPVLLPGVDKFPEHLLFLKELNWVHFTNGIDDSAALDRLVWGITGERQGENSSPQSPSNNSSSEQRDVAVTTPPISKYTPPVPKYAKQLLIRNRDDLNQLSAFFRYTTKLEKEEEVTPIDIYQLISDMPDDGKCTSLALNGEQGTGKTAFLSVLYAALNSTAISRSQRRYPLFIDADDYTNITNKRERILQDIESLRNAIDSNKNDCRFVLMVDGLTGREKETCKIICQQLLFLNFNVFDTIIWSITDDFETILNETLRENPSLIPSKCIQFHSLKVNDNILNYLEDFIFLYNRINGRSLEGINPSDDAQFLADRLNIIVPGDEIDQHILSLIYEKLNVEHYFDYANLANFLEKYCLEQLSEGVIPRSQTERLNLLRRAAWLAYRIVIEAFYRGQVPRDLQIEVEERSNRFWSLVSQHSNIRDFLVAWYVIDLIRYRDSNSSAVGFSGNLNGDIVNRDRIGYDFPQIVNRFMRYILDSNLQTGNDVVTSISRILKYFERNQTKQLLQTANLLYYLLGRCRVAVARQDELLQRATRQVEKKLANAVENERIQLLTQYRTISISRMRLGNNNSSKEFLSKLLRNNLLASIDRGYHRLYYGDAQTFKEDVPTCYLDDERESWSKSFEALKDRLDQEVLSLSYNDDTNATNSNSGGLENNDTDPDAEELSVQTQHYIFTLVSFVQSRIEEVSACAETQRSYAKRVINHLLSQKNIVLLPELRQYLGMMQVDLEQDNSYSSRWRFVLNLYRLKWEPRRGWLLRNLQPNFQVGRIESVADHSYAALLLATLLLPDKLEEAPDYKREDVIRKLIFHDIAEAYTGDFIFHLLNDKNKKEAKGKEWQALAYLRFKQTYSGLNNTLAIFEDSLDFSAAEGNRLDTNRYIPASNTSPPSDSAKVARDIDKLENLIQLFLYKEMHPGFINDEDFQTFVDSLLNMHTEYVRYLTEDFMKWAKLYQGNLLRWCDKFFDDRLLQKHERVIDVRNQLMM